MDTDNYNIDFMHNLIQGEGWCEFYSLVITLDKNTTDETKPVMTGLSEYLFPENYPIKQNCVARQDMQKQWCVKMNKYATRITEIKRFLNIFPG